MYLYLMDVPFRSKEPLVTLDLNLLPEESLACQHTPASNEHGRTQALMALQGHCVTPGFVEVLLTPQVTDCKPLPASPNE